MKTFLLSVFIFLISFKSYSQKKKEEEIFTAVEQQAEFPGGMGALGKYLQKNLNLQFDKDENRPSNLYIQFVVEKNGSISHFEVLKNILSKQNTKNLKKLFSSVKWKPGYQSGKPVRSRFTIPINHLNYGE